MLIVKNSNSLSIDLCFFFESFQHFPGRQNARLPCTFQVLAKTKYEIATSDFVLLAMTEKVSALARTKYEIATDFYEVLAMTEKVSALVMASPFVSARSVSDEAVSVLFLLFDTKVEMLKQVQHDKWKVNAGILRFARSYPVFVIPSRFCEEYIILHLSS
jgi:hypothetical protein